MVVVSGELKKLMEEILGKGASIFFTQIGIEFDHIIRFNPLKGHIQYQKELLEQQGFELESLETWDYAFKVTYAPYPIGKTLSHFLGHIYVQDLSSMIPPLVLNPQPGDWVLDVSAAPGSKTTQMAAVMQNEGILVANDADPKRVQALSYNIERMGAVQTHIINTAGERIGKLYPELFDKVLLDPPCSGLGTLHKNPEINNWWSEEYSVNLAERQFHLLRSAVRALRPGGELVYSTCTLTPWENEMVVDRALKEFPLELMEIPPLKGLKVHPGFVKFRGYTFHPDVEKCIRLNPNENRTEGFFVAKFKKTESMNLEPVKSEAHTFHWLTDKQSPAKKYVDFIAEEFGIDRKFMRQFKYGIGRRINLIRKEAADFPLYFKPERFGLPFCTPMERGAKLTTEAVHFLGPQITQNVIRLEDIRELEKFVNREKLVVQFPSRGQKIVFYGELPIGYGYYDGKKLKSYFPRSEWPFRMSNI